MQIVKTIAVAAALLAGVSAANASTLNIAAIQSATTATVLAVNATDAKLLGYDNDVTAIRANIQGNAWLVQNIERQGFNVDQIVGATGGQTNLTFYAK